MDAQGSNLKLFFQVVLFSQTLFSILNSVYILPDLNLPIAVVGYYGGVAASITALRLYMYLNAVSFIADLLRTLLWEPTSLSSSVIAINAPQYVYFSLVAFGAIAKIIGSILSYFLVSRFSELGRGVSQKLLSVVD